MLSIVIPTLHKPARLRLALTSIAGALQLQAVDAEIVVVDDGGGDAGPAVGEVVSRFPGLRLRLVAQARGGRSVARNRGAAESRGRWLLFLDDDVLVTPETIAQHVRAAEQPHQGLCRGTILHLPWLAAFDDPERGRPSARVAALGGSAPGLESRRVVLDARGCPDARFLRWARMTRFERDLHALLAQRPPEATGRWVAATGAHLALSREDFLRLGGFDERMGMRWGAEDLELGFRIERSGLPIRHLKEAVVYHMDHDTSGREQDHDLALRYFADKHGSPQVLQLGAYFAGRLPLCEVLS